MNIPIPTDEMGPSANAGLPFRDGRDLYRSLPCVAIDPDRDETCSTVYTGFGIESLDSVRSEFNDEADAVVVVDIDGTVDADDNLSTTSTTAHVPLRLSFDEVD